MRPNMIDRARPALGLGYILPGMVLARLAKRRAHRIRLSLADALDLLVVSVEAGLGLDQALTARRQRARVRVSGPVATSCGWSTSSCAPASRAPEALRNLADRTGVDDLSSLVTMLIQTDKFGTSVAQSLRVYSETLRTKRRQRAEEAAAKTGVKMVFPLVLCIFPAIWVVTIGPAAIKFVTVLFPMIDRQDDSERSRFMTIAIAESPAAGRDVAAGAAAAAGDDEGDRAFIRTRCSQLLLKTLVAGEASGTELAERLRLPYSVLDALIQHARVEKLRRGARRERRRHRRLSLRADRPRPRSRPDSSSTSRRYVGPAPVPLAQYNAYVRACMARAALRRPRARWRPASST